MSNADGIYTRRDREGYWMHWSDAQGRRRWRKLNVNTLQQARKARAAEMVRVEQSRVLGFAAPGKDTFSDVATRFLAHQKARLTPKAYKREAGIVNEHLSKFFSGPLASIRRLDVQRYVTKRAGEVSAHSVQKEVNICKHLLRLAVEWEIVPFNAAHGVKCPRVATGRVRYLQPGELRTVLEACPDWLRPIIALAACTGMRRSELLGLRWLNVDLSNGRVLLSQTKNGESRIVYLNETAKAAIRSLPFDMNTHSTDPLFRQISGEQVSMAFQRACKVVKISDFRFHDLRHTAASWLRMKGADIHTVAQLLGHKDLRMAARYQHLSPSFLAEAVAHLDATFALPSLSNGDGTTEAQASPESQKKGPCPALAN
jgi:integrase